MRAGIFGLGEQGGGDIANAEGKRCKISGFPFRWFMGDGSIVRMVAYIDVKDFNPVPDPVYKCGTWQPRGVTK